MLKVIVDNGNLHGSQIQGIPSGVAQFRLGGNLNPCAQRYVQRWEGHAHHGGVFHRITVVTVSALSTRSLSLFSPSTV